MTTWHDAVYNQHIEIRVAENGAQVLINIDVATNDYTQARGHAIQRYTYHATYGHGLKLEENHTPATVLIVATYPNGTVAHIPAAWSSHTQVEDQGIHPMMHSAMDKLLEVIQEDVRKHMHDYFMKVLGKQTN